MGPLLQFRHWFIGRLSAGRYLPVPHAMAFCCEGQKWFSGHWMHAFDERSWRYTPEERSHSQKKYLEEVLLDFLLFAGHVVHSETEPLME